MSDLVQGSCDAHGHCNKETDISLNVIWLDSVTEFHLYNRLIVSKGGKSAMTTQLLTFCFVFLG